MFGLLTGIIYLAGGAGFAVALAGGHPFESPTGGLMLLAIIGAIASSWLANVPALHSDAEE